MARVTVEDCLMKVPNRFELVLLAARRTRQLSSGDEPTLPLDKDKSTVLALREIAEGTLDLDALRRFQEAPPQEEDLEEEALRRAEEARNLLARESRLASVDDDETELSRRERDLFIDEDEEISSKEEAEADEDDDMDDVSFGDDLADFANDD